MNPATPARTTTPTCTGEMHEAAFSTTGPAPTLRVALTHSIAEARQRLADMLIFCDPTAPAAADLTAFHPPRLVESYTGTTGDIFTQVNTRTPAGPSPPDPSPAPPPPTRPTDGGEPS